MQSLSYNHLFHQPSLFSGIAENGTPPYGKKDPEDEEEELYGTEEALYEEMLQHLEDKYLQDRFSMCLEIRDGNRVVYVFPKIACPELIVEQLRIKTRKL